MFGVVTSNGLWEDAFTKKYIIWPLTLTKVAQLHLHNVTYTPAKFKVATSVDYGLEEDIFPRKYITSTLSVPYASYDLYTRNVEVAASNSFGERIHYLTLTLVARKVAQYPLHHLQGLSCYVQRFRRRCIYKKKQYLTFDLDLRAQNIAQYTLHHVTYTQANFEVAICPTV